MKKKFIEYAKSFYSGHPETDRNLELKLAHTFRVQEEARKLAEAENLPERPILRTALLHDLSRFEQFTLYRSFNDAASYDHGNRSAELAQEFGFLEDLPQEDAQDVLAAIRAHNKVAIPPGLMVRAQIIAGAVRDADKLDILPILLDHLADPGNEAITFNLSKEPVLSPEVAEALTAHRSPHHADMRTVADFIAAKIVWIHDLNYPYSRREFLRRGYLDELMKYLPDIPLIRQLYRNAVDHRESAG